MKSSEWLTILKNGTSADFNRLYANDPTAVSRFENAIRAFERKYGKDREIAVFSVPGRSEIAGNHTDHNRGCVLAGAIDRDIIAIAAKNDDNCIRVQSDGYREISVPIERCADPKNFDPFCSGSLVAGMAGGFLSRGYAVGGFDAYTTTRVLKGSGLSSSAAFEVMVGTVLNHFFNEGRIPAPEVAKVAQYSENVYFGKPCGLMDQMACAVGGFVFIDFADPEKPIIRPIRFSLTGAGYSLAIVNTGGSHSDLNDDYASVPAEMKKVASFFGREVLRGTTEEELLGSAAVLRRTVGDRALLRAFHFVRENDRVVAQREALEEGRIADFLQGEIASGRSSFEYLQNVYTNKNVAEQGLSLALAITEGLLGGRDCAWRVHGGGFAGTIQAFVRRELAEEYAAAIDSVFGKGACMLLSIREDGATRILP
ncbi:MAG: galactokinase [Clostridia bacterium]|nr:galactokinase [Clostridia bacterium]